MLPPSHHLLLPLGIPPRGVFVIFLQMLPLSSGLWDTVLVICTGADIIWDFFHFLERHEWPHALMLEEHGALFHSLVPRSFI